ncbi:hypothetical protein VNI00_001375 [Paramarasmius palmivorus]|uniref:Cytochrome P450 n=1 Tax=Paramarasmius palmivorus TaxID=297713 RepID=A0AAW0EBK5_9AGAR
MLCDIHAKQRRLLAPFFSTKFLRSLLPLFYPFAYELCDNIEKRSKSNDGVINMHKMMSIAALEYVGAGLGYQFDGLNEDKPNIYNDAAKAINPLTFKLSTFRVFLPWMVKLGPGWFRKALIDWVPWPDAQRLKKVIYTIDDVAQDILKTRRQAYEDGQINGKDILSAMLRFNDEADEDEKISDYEILSHITTTLFAGHETTTLKCNLLTMRQAGTLSRILYQMAILPKVQARLRKEVTEARAKDGDLDFEQLMELPYLDAVCKETLRCNPPVDQLYRTSNTHSVIPIMHPVRSADGKTMIDHVAVEPKTDLIISIIGYNRNKDVWGDDAEQWIPERWLEPPRQSVIDAKLPAVFSNIGYKFAEMEMKLILTMLLERFEFSISPKEEIFWQMGGSITPIVKGSGQIEPTLPLKVTPLPKPERK